MYLLNMCSLLYAIDKVVKLLIWKKLTKKNFVWVDEMQVSIFYSNKNKEQIKKPDICFNNVELKF